MKVAAVIGVKDRILVQVIRDAIGTEVKWFLNYDELLVAVKENSFNYEWIIASTSAPYNGGEVKEVLTSLLELEIPLIVFASEKPLFSNKLVSWIIGQKFKTGELQKEIIKIIERCNQESDVPLQVQDDLITENSSIVAAVGQSDILEKLKTKGIDFISVVDDRDKLMHVINEHKPGYVLLSVRLPGYRDFKSLIDEILLTGTRLVLLAGDTDPDEPWVKNMQKWGVKVYFDPVRISGVTAALQGKTEKEEEEISVGDGGTVKEQVVINQIIRSNIIAFWSLDSSLINHGLALFTALKLAEKNFKVALIEPVTDLPKLAVSLDMIHPFYNTSHAVTMFAEHNTKFIKDCLINSEKYLDDPRTPEQAKTAEIGCYPKTLYILPDVKKMDNIKNPGEHWRNFILELSRIIVFEKKFDFLIFDCSQNNDLNKTIINDVAYLKFLVTGLHPAGVSYALNQRDKSPDNYHLVASKYVDFLYKELGDSLLYVPETFENDIIKFIYLKDSSLTEESQAFVNQLIERIGVQMPEQSQKQGVLSFLKKKVTALPNKILEVKR